MTYVFLDTMIYLHYKWFEDIDFKNVVGDQEVQIVVPHITLHELDTHKDNHKSSKIRERARKVAGRFLECFLEYGGTLKGSLTACEFDESGMFDFAAHNLDKSKNDHRLLAAILEFKESQSESVFLITQDVGPRLKANRLGIDVKALLETYRLPSEEDPLVKENKQLKNKLFMIQSAAPKLSLGFDDMDAKKNELIVYPSAKKVIDAEAVMEKVRDKFPWKGSRPETTNNSLGNLFVKTHLPPFAAMPKIPDSEYERYNGECAKYFEQYEAYLSELQRRQQQCFAELNLCVQNEGGAPAEDVDVFMHFPDGFELYPVDDLPEEPKSPRPPQEPRTVIEQSMENLNFASSLIHPRYFPDIASLGPPDPFSLKKTNSYEVEDAFQRIKHGQTGVIRPLMVVFDSYGSATSFQITYRMLAANLPQPVEGELNIVVKEG